MFDHLGFSRNKNSRYSTGIGYVVIPNDVDRDKFVTTCLNNCTVSIVRDYNSFGIINGVKVSPDDIQEIEFPDETLKIGSCVVFVTDQKSGQPFIVSILPKGDEIKNYKERTKIIEKKSQDGTSIIKISADSPSVEIIVDSNIPDSEINISCRGQNSKVNLNSFGQVNINGLTNVRVNSEKEVELTVEDENGASSFIITPNKIEHKSEVVNHNDGNEPILRGNKSVELIEKLLDLLFNARVSTSIGLQPLTTFVEINALKTELESLKSTKSFIE